MPTIRYVLTMNDGTVKVVYSREKVASLEGQYKSIKTEKITDNGWKEVPFPFSSTKKEPTPLEVSKELKDFVLEYTKNGLDRRFVIGSFDIIETALKNYESRKVFLDNVDNNVIVFEPKEVWEEKQKKLKAFEIIVSRLGTAQIKDKFTMFFGEEDEPLTKEEYETIQEVLLNE